MKLRRHRRTAARATPRESPEDQGPVVLGHGLLDVEPTVPVRVREQPSAFGPRGGEKPGTAPGPVREGAADRDGFGIGGRHPCGRVVGGERQGVVEQPQGGRPGRRVPVPDDGEEQRGCGDGGGEDLTAVVVHEPATGQERAGVGGLDESRRRGEGTQSGGGAVGLVPEGGARQRAPVHGVDRVQHGGMIPSRPGGRKRSAPHAPQVPRWLPPSSLRPALQPPHPALPGVDRLRPPPSALQPPLRPRSRKAVP